MALHILPLMMIPSNVVMHRDQDDILVFLGGAQEVLGQRQRTGVIAHINGR
jgi:hypothetical protein